MIRRILLLFIATLFMAMPIASEVMAQQRYQVLLFTKSESYPWRHNSISEGVQMFKELSQFHRFGLTWTADSQIFEDEERLSGMDVVVFFNTSGDILNETQKEGFQNYIRSGGNFVGIHGATFTMMEWEWYIGMLGGVWDRHPGIHTALVNVEQADHPSTTHLPANWLITEEWYNFLSLSDNIQVLLAVDETTYPGGEMPEYHPIAWYQDNFEGSSRTFYTLLGHTEEIYSDYNFQQHILGAIWWAATGHSINGN